MAVVVVVLGVLGAAALSRFVDLSDDAKAARVAEMGGAFREAVGLAHAKWIAQGASASLNAIAAEGGSTIGVNDAGWPENAFAGGGNGVVTASECVELWSDLLVSPPSVSTTTGAAAWLASVEGTTTCRYVDNETSGLEFRYDTRTGAVATTLVASTAPTASSGGGSTVTPSSAPSGSGGSGGAGSGTTTSCGLVGAEPFAALALLRLAHALRRSRFRLRTDGPAAPTSQSPLLR